jgi:hypothetical protein
VLRIDHPVRAVADLDRAAKRWRRDLGLDSVAGGRHPGWGTANRIVPLGDAYVELIAVADPQAARASAFGRSVLDAAAGGGRWLTFAAAPDDLDAVAARLGLEVTEGRRERPDGTTLRWRSAGLEDPRREPWMPFFIAWEGTPDLHPGRARAGHVVRPSGIARIEVAGDAVRLGEWLGGADLPVRVVAGPPGIRAVVVAVAGGELVIA